MKKHIVIVHGVGLNVDIKTINTFGNRLSDKTGATCQLFQWNHPSSVPADPRDKNQLFAKFRRWTHDVLMDAVYAVKSVIDSNQLKLPDADFYIGHSAGGILCGALSDKPRVLMGCPLTLVKNVVTAKTAKDTVLNLMAKNDLLASVVPDAVNMVISDQWRWYWIGPQYYIYSHCCYWENVEALDYCVEWFNRTVR